MDFILKYINKKICFVEEGRRPYLELLLRIKILLLTVVVLWTNSPR